MRIVSVEVERKMGMLKAYDSKATLTYNVSLVQWDLVLFGATSSIVVSEDDKLLNIFMSEKLKEVTK